MTKGSAFTISASIGFALVLVYLCVCTCEADMTTISRALDTIGQLKPVAIFNTVYVLYMLLAVTPLLFALNCGAMGIVCYALWKFIKTYYGLSNLFQEKRKMS